MINTDILYAPPEKQIEKLKRQGLIISDESFAKDQLELYGYSNLIKSYRDPYIYMNNGHKLYRTGVTFEQIYSLYILDKNLRNAVIASMLDFEEHIKESAADIVASCFGVSQDSYLNFKNYRDKQKRKSRFSLSGILNTMQETLTTDKNPIAHYMKNYGVVPPWILFKSIYLGTIVNFINLFKPTQQLMLVEKLYSTSSISLSEQQLRFLMLDTLFCCLEYRNLAAHGGRIYNHTCKSKVRLAEQGNIPSSGFSQLLFLLDTLKYDMPYYHLSSALSQEINRHCTSFPQDVTYLGLILNINITSKNYVWITRNSNKYHTVLHCSGIKSPRKIELSEAQHQGYIPCKKCCQNLIT